MYTVQRFPHSTELRAKYTTRTIPKVASNALAKVRQILREVLWEGGVWECDVTSG